MTEEKKMYKYENWIEAPRSAEVAIGIRQIAMEAGIDVTINTETTGLLFKKDTVFFKVVSSDFDKVERFRLGVINAINNYQSQTSHVSGYGV